MTFDDLLREKGRAWINADGAAWLAKEHPELFEEYLKRLEHQHEQKVAKQWAESFTTWQRDQAGRN